MAEQKSDKKERLSGHLSEHKVTRIQGHMQIYADAAVAIVSPRNLDLAFLKIGSIVTDCEVEEGRQVPTKFSLEPSVSEIGRVTLNISTAVTLAVDILDEAAEGGLLSVAALKEKIEEYEMLENQRSEDTKSDG